MNVHIESEAYNRWWKKEGISLHPHGMEGYYLAFSVAFEAGRKAQAEYDQFRIRGEKEK